MHAATIDLAVPTPSQPRAVRVYPGDPKVSIILPCFNEERFIEACLLSVLAGDFPRDMLEVLVVDGASTDGTRAIVERLAAVHPEIRIIDNPRRIKPVALNIGIEQAVGDVVIRLDAHATYPTHYVSTLVRYLLTYDVVNVGGVRRNLPRNETLVARVLARLLTHWMGVGNARHYTGVAGPQYTEIVFLFCVRRKLFDEVGVFKEPLIRGQDREFNLRLAASGRKMLLVPDVTSNYYARGDLNGFFRWAFEAGATPFRINRHADINTVSWRNLAPPGFLLGLGAAVALAVVWPLLGAIALASIVIPYVSVAVRAALQIAAAEDDWRFAPAMPIAFFAWHVAYGTGALYAIVEALVTRKVPAV